jgi:hypothetical protein
MYRAYILSLLLAGRIPRDCPAVTGFLYDKAGEVGETKQRFRVYSRNYSSPYLLFAVFRAAFFFSLFIRYVPLQGFIPYLGPFCIISLIHLSFASRGFVLSCFENSRGLPKNKIRHSDPSVDRTIESVRQLEQVFESYRMVFK